MSDRERGSQKSFQTPEGCMWPHHVTQPICVYDRESYEKYRTGEYRVPDHCICGAELTYDAPVCICLVENGQLNGEMLMEVEYPVEWVDLHVVREGVKRQESWLDEMKKANPEEP